MKSAYRRCHTDAITSVRQAIRVEIDGVHHILITLRLAFGGAPGPPEFSILSDMITDTVNDLYECKNWNPNQISSDFKDKVPDVVRQPKEVPKATSRDFSVKYPDSADNKADVFIDDIVSVGLDTPENVVKLKAAPCTVLHSVCHKSDNTHIPRVDILSEMKNKEEGAPEEIKTVLGWDLDTRRLLIKLPPHKAKAWSSELNKVASHSSVDEETLLRILGRLENIATVMTPLGHFLNNIGHLQIKASRSKHNVRINSRVRKDLRLAIKFTQEAALGVDMNLVSFRKPDIVHIGDASEYGMGSFANHGRAWRYLIPDEFQGRAHINVLEFLTQVVSLWIDIIERKVKPGDCVLCMGDNTSAMGWLRRSNFREDNEEKIDWLVKQKIARKLAHLVLEYKLVLYKQ